MITTDYRGKNSNELKKKKKSPANYLSGAV
jgi:hypothetical protein